MTRPTLASPRPGGRPRDESRDGAIRQATLELLAEHGYDGVTMDRVATRAKAGKATIYRRWPSKVALVMDSITQFTEQTLQIPDSGSLRTEMILFLTAFHELVGSEQGRIMAEMVSEMPRNPELRAAVRERMWSQRKMMSEVIITRGIARGEITPEADPAILMEIGTALILQRLLITGDPVDSAFIEHVVDDVIIAYASRG
ncbi:TetR/AcrR family transcriptional regulator [Frankia sp. Mgl5]|uniref:TetR family transcriptional regulator n=1 Tax=Parafrankia soli TaxID=2599596 RepID=A0A1S1PKH6_9ACTN|nr:MULTISPECIES: TetR/AcrR family transcriptional regulator C-terminal ligand-binding domain-containing protein [Frankiaceae]ABW15252.1 transcriptional regulator, TetR family [Frankia sp. EAN1pec]CAI7975835.1 Transcriptional regulator, TetR family [Frankia sp. Hr75.2]MCK9926171.1 TetR/AcrR family transcriptional regulator [Frankia sp. Mgl5]OHV21609.1 TetR family transcriptional regulator [Parafrankia soli]TCJ34431.1 TetR/AcrR family transcriptional regulator [Parafrankia sp. BMG5.11]